MQRRNGMSPTRLNGSKLLWFGDGIWECTMFEPKQTSLLRRYVAFMSQPKQGLIPISPIPHNALKKGIESQRIRGMLTYSVRIRQDYHNRVYNYLSTHLLDLAIQKQTTPLFSTSETSFFLYGSIDRFASCRCRVSRPLYFGVWGFEILAVQEPI